MRGGGLIIGVNSSIGTVMNSTMSASDIRADGDDNCLFCVGGDGNSKICICCLCHNNEKLRLSKEHLLHLILACDDSTDLVGETNGGGKDQGWSLDPRCYVQA